MFKLLVCLTAKTQFLQVAVHLVIFFPILFICPFSHELHGSSLWCQNQLLQWVLDTLSCCTVFALVFESMTRGRHQWDPSAPEGLADFTSPTQNYCNPCRATTFWSAHGYCWGKDLSLGKSSCDGIGKGAPGFAKPWGFGQAQALGHFLLLIWTSLGFYRSLLFSFLLGFSYCSSRSALLFNELFYSLSYFVIFIPTPSLYFVS